MRLQSLVDRVSGKNKFFAVKYTYLLNVISPQLNIFKARDLILSMSNLESSLPVILRYSGALFVA